MDFTGRAMLHQGFILIEFVLVFYTVGLLEIDCIGYQEFDFESLFSKVCQNIVKIF
jgi:hypothetical protein